MVLQCDVASHQNALSFFTRDELANQREAKKPDWVDAFLKKTFFGRCKDHPCRKNELNKYCIDCDKPTCQYCALSAPHKQHKILKVYRHIYKDVVSLGTMDKYIDCADIQPYKSNKRLVLSLNPLPRCGASSNNGLSCNLCSKKLVEPNVYRYCSIFCKVRAGSPEPNGSVPHVISDENPSIIADENPSIIADENPSIIADENQNPQEAEEQQEEPMPVSYRRKRRKGNPCRAPFF